MGVVSRNIKNIARNLVFSSNMQNIPFVRKKINERRINIEEQRKFIFKKYGNETLAKVKEVLDAEKIIFWLDFGTLLGAVREKDFIEHDIDIDLGIMYDKDLITSIEKALKANDIEKVREFKVDGDIVEQTYIYKGLAFDIFYYFNDGVDKWSYGFNYGNSKLTKTIYANMDVSTGISGVRYITRISGVEQLLFKGDMYNVPENPHEYLTCNYGPNYMIPNDKWDSNEDPKNQEVIDPSLEIQMIEYF